MYATFIPVFGKGKYGTVTQQIIPALNFPPVGLTAPTEIAVTPAGKVYISGAPRLNGNAIMTVNPTGTVNLGPDSFSAKRDIAFSNLESFGTVVPYMPNRNSLSTQGFGRIEFDPEKNRLYLGLQDMQPDFSGDMTLNLVHTDDDGQTWSTVRPIADTNKQARGTLSMSRDPITGNLLFSWYDARDQEDQTNVNTFMAILTKKELDREDQSGSDK